MAVERVRVALLRAGAVVIASLAVARLFAHWPRIWDIEFWDESNYLAAGLWNWPGAMTRYEDFPLYSKFYHVLALALGSDDAARLYMLGGLLVILMGLAGVGLGVWAASKSLGASIASIAIVALTSALIWPRVVFLSLFVQGVGFAASTRTSNRFAKLSVIALTCYVATFVRSEFVIGFYVAAAAAIASVHALISRRPERLRGYAAGLVALATIAALSVLWSFPVLRGNRRAMAAFGQHYGLRFVERHHLDINPWANPERIVSMDFPGAQSVFGALRVNPAALTRFFAENALGIVPRTWRSILPIHFVPWGAGGLLLIAIALWVACRPDARRAPRANEHGNVLCAAVLLLPPTLSVIVVFPRDHYVVQVMAAQMFVLAALARAAPESVAKSSERLSGWMTPHVRAWGPILLAICFLLWARPLPVVGQPNLARVRAIHALPAIERMLEADGGLCTYAMPRCETVWGDTVPANASFARYLDDNRIDAVAASPGLLRSISIRENPSFQEFVSTATEHGWTRYEIPGEHPILVLVRSKNPAS